MGNRKNRRDAPNPAFSGSYLEHCVLLLCSVVDQIKKKVGVGHQNKLSSEMRLLALAS